MVREARPEELPSIGALRVEAYERGGFLRPDDPYAGTLRALGRQRDGTVLVAEDSGRLLRAVISRAAAASVHRLLLSTQPTMRAAHSLYESEGFRRAPELDWQPVPGYTLLVYEMAVPRRPG